MKELRLSRGKVALVDDEDFYWLSQWNWSANLHKDGKCYANRSPKRVGRTFPKNCEVYETALHRVVMRCTDKNLVVDHIDGNGLNNQKNNLRICTHSENTKNVKKRRKNTTSRYKGIHWSRKRKGWVMQVRSDGVIITRYYKDEFLAANAYDYYAKKHHGEFANLNFDGIFSADLVARILAPCEREWTMSDEHKKALKVAHKKVDWIAVSKCKGKKVLDTSTGIVYDTARDAANSLGINHRTLCGYLSGERTNKTVLQYA